MIEGVCRGTGKGKRRKIVTIKGERTTSASPRASASARLKVKRRQWTVRASDRTARGYKFRVPTSLPQRKATGWGRYRERPTELAWSETLGVV